MHVLNVIGCKYLGATMAPIFYDGYWAARTFMTFDPIDTLYCPPKTDGSYISNITNIAVYASTYQRLLKLDMIANFRQMYILALVYDFMAFCAQTFRDVLDERQGTA